MKKVLRFHNKKVRVGRFLSIFVPIVTATLLSFGNDFLSWFFMEENGIVNIESVKSTMMISNILLVFGLICSIILSNIIFRRVLRKELEIPLQKISEGMGEMRKGNLDYRISYEDGDTLYELYEDFNEMIAETRRLSVKASQIDQGRKELLLDVSHDLKSPLTSIIAYVQGLIDGIAKTDEMRERYLQTIKKKALDINKMVERIFLFAKLDTDNYVSNPELLSVNEEIEEIISQVRRDQENNPRLVLEERFEGNGKIYGDSDILKRVCLNIIENSMKYNDKELTIIRISVKEEEKNVRILFADNGPGVEKEQLPHLWDIFYRGDQARSNPSSGSGIGLSIVKKSVEQMQGKVTARIGKNGGLVTTIRIPKYIEEND